MPVLRQRREYHKMADTKAKGAKKRFGRQQFSSVGQTPWKERKVGGKRYEARSRSSPLTLAFRNFEIFQKRPRSVLYHIVGNGCFVAKKILRKNLGETAYDGSVETRHTHPV